MNRQVTAVFGAAQLRIFVSVICERIDSLRAVLDARPPGAPVDLVGQHQHR